MGKSPAFQLYAADFYMDTVGWTATEVGAYFRLLMHEWVNGPLPNNMADLSRIAGISDARTLYKMWSRTLVNKFTTTDGNLLINKRLESEREKQSINRELQVKKGISGANKRWENRIAPAIAQAQPKDSSSSSISSSINKSIFNKPHIEEIALYCNSRKNNINPQIFYDHYESNGWMIGKNKMKNWQAAIRTWEQREGGNGNGRSDFGGSKRTTVEKAGRAKSDGEPYPIDFEFS